MRGRSGAGKSTLLRLLLGLADPDSGSVRLAAEVAPLRRAQRADVRRDLVGVSMQSGALAEPLDTWENLALARAARGLPDDTDAVQGVVGALGLDAVSRRPVRLLSGGERQRVAIARSLITQRPLVVLDEPTSQQDEAHAELVTAVLVASARAGTAVVAATHDPVLAAAADATIDLCRRRAAAHPRAAPEASCNVSPLTRLGPVAGSATARRPAGRPRPGSLSGTDSTCRFVVSSVARDRR